MAIHVAEAIPMERPRNRCRPGHLQRQEKPRPARVSFPSINRNHVVANDEDGDLTSPAPADPSLRAGIFSPLEAHGSYRGPDWSPERLAFHQNLESFAERVGLIVGLQSNGKLSQEVAYAEISKLWKALRESKDSLLTDEANH